MCNDLTIITRVFYGEDLAGDRRFCKLEPWVASKVFTTAVPGEWFPIALVINRYNQLMHSKTVSNFIQNPQGFIRKCPCAARGSDHQYTSRYQSRWVETAPRPMLMHRSRQALATATGNTTTQRFEGLKNITLRLFQERGTPLATVVLGSWIVWHSRTAQARTGESHYDAPAGLARSVPSSTKTEPSLRVTQIPRTKRKVLIHLRQERSGLASFLTIGTCNRNLDRGSWGFMEELLSSGWLIQLPFSQLIAMKRERVE
ncbi:hypothetical protein JB92DRAFT_2830674 [Gautieria morchelliformis]|nr:hypothetical protein JB92DRAFT_2830674 [Gautieria morchelliformis]